MRHMMNVYLPPELLQQIGDLASRRKLFWTMIFSVALGTAASIAIACSRSAWVKRATS